jgi:outer membrane protein assembly factor BamB
VVLPERQGRHVALERRLHGAAFSAGGENAVPSIDGAGNVFVYSPADGKIWRFDAAGNVLPSIAVPPAMNEFVIPQVAIGAGGTLYVSGADGRLWALK